MSKYLALDIGQVIYDIDLDSFIEELRTKLNSEINNVYNSARNRHYDPEAFVLDLHGQQDVGLTTVERALKDTFGFTTTETNQLVEEWEKIPQPNEEMMAWIKKLEENGVKIALLSNIGKTHARLLGEKFPETYANKVLHLSCEVGARKPSKLYYQSFLMDHPEFKGCLYLDDRQENIEVGNKYGFKSVKFDLDDFQDPLKLKAQLNIFRDMLGVKYD